MSEFVQFLKLLQRNKITLILVPLITVILCYFLVRRLPDTFESHARIATGLVDKTDQVVTKAKDEQDQQIARKFESLIQVLRLKRTIDQVSYRLILNDLKGLKDSTWREPVKELESMSKADKSKAIALITQKYKNREELFLSKPYENYLNNIIVDMGYGANALREKLIIYRTGVGDYIDIEFEAENPDLAAYVINTLSEEFISDNSSRVVGNNKKTIDFLQNFMLQKLSALNTRMNTLRNFKIQNRVLNLNEQAKSIYGQMADYETRREVAQKDIVALGAAINNIDKKFDPTERKYFESALTGINQKIIASKSNLRALNERYVLSNFDQRLKFSLDSLRTQLTEEIDEATDKYAYNPMALKQDLVTQKLQMEISLELAKNSVASIQGELNRLNRKFDGLVPNEATIQEYETSIDIASKEYIEALQRYNEASLEFSFPVYLRLIERAMPGEVQASKKMVLVVLSGVISFTFCVFVFFILFYIDKSIRYPLQLANATERPVLGYLNALDKGSNLSLSGMNASDDKSIRLYKNLVRSIRYELDNEIDDPKIIAVTSLSYGVGKTSFVVALAWAFSKINKSVLIIDGNFGQPDISKLNPDTSLIENFVNSSSIIEAKAGQISILGNKGGDISLLELADEKSVGDRLQVLKTHFDIILVETDSLTAMNKAKEWITFSDRVVAVFAAGRSISDDDQSKIQYLNNLEDKFSGWVLTNTEDIPEQAGKIGKPVEV
ncbi:exopolysaccharide transport family protein [Dyadobacter fanqingshengii]|uniref:Lipopolysaccharide biosynthesis protein n=1 Tax=Dyadobacter fanqingshengii TaxID=2906443 RepID=A0A9X1PBE1_9BACT|nr:lipopolysaccharide biosynthesis protein [Dyadobacter fanqingshengii]MCF0041861.1 lipopolysaccharide biosynthesis protein [Dyadobacter fanqingshengii]USJ36430.1 lipopolysaccharide biosynthesis protein [Dyadobacter fanqingshengii]